MKFFVVGASWGAELGKVDKIYTRGESFSKKGHFDKIFGILPSTRYGPGNDVVCKSCVVAN